MSVQRFTRRSPFLAVSAMVAWSCGQPASEPATVAPPPVPPATTGLRGTIDMRTGALEFETGGGLLAASGASRAIFGDQGLLVRLYNTPVAIDSVSVPGTKTWTGNVGLQNLMTHSIGDEQTGVAPDTMGVFVFFNTTPTVTAPSPCVGCSVTINRFDGTGNFTAAGQRYSWWAERVAAGDTTRVRKLWSFSAPSQVTRFSFSVLVSAAWPAPDETRWKVTLNNDSIPDTQEEPRWRRQTLGTGNSATATGGFLALATTSTTGELDFYRRDSVTSASSAYAEARFSSTVTTATPAEFLVFDDATKFIAVGVAATSAWFADSSRTFLAGTRATVTASALNTYQLRKYGADSVVLYVNGNRAGRFTYSGLPNTAFPTVAPLVAFGQRARGVATSSSWDYVVYEIGTPLP